MKIHRMWHRRVFIQHDLFRPDSYLVRANAKLNLRNQKIEIGYQKPGPLVALLVATTHQIHW